MPREADLSLACLGARAVLLRAAGRSRALAPGCWPLGDALVVAWRNRSSPSGAVVGGHEKRGKTTQRPLLLVSGPCHGAFIPEYFRIGINHPRGSLLAELLRGLLM